MDGPTDRWTHPLIEALDTKIVVLTWYIFFSLSKVLEKKLQKFFKVAMQNPSRVTKKTVPNTNLLAFFFDRYTNLNEMQAKVESTQYEEGTTETAMAMEKALALYKRDQRKDKDTARVTEDNNER